MWLWIAVVAGCAGPAEDNGTDLLPQTDLAEEVTEPGFLRRRQRYPLSGT